MQMWQVTFWHCHGEQGGRLSVLVLPRQALMLEMTQHVTL